MTAIKATWTGGGLADGTDLTASNINAAGNSVGSGITWSTVGSGTGRKLQKSGSGIRFWGTGSINVQVRATPTATAAAMRAQCILTVTQKPAGELMFLQAYNQSNANAGWVSLRPDRTFEIYHGASIVASRTPAVTVGSKILIDIVWAESTSSRVFYRVTNLSDPAWNDGVPFFFDTGYTLASNTSLNMAIFGAPNASDIPEPGYLLERLGAEGITVSSSDTSESAAKAYFADAPGDPLPTPVVTVTATKNPSTATAADGTITATWPAVAGASRYEAGIADGVAVDGFVTVSSSATSPYTWTGLKGGVKTIAVRAVP